jgi:hypothetical protein
MISRGFLAMLLTTFALVMQNCSNKKEAQSEMILKITNSEEFTSFVNDYNSGKFHINDSLISPLVVTLENDISIINNHLSPIGSEEYPFIGTFEGNDHTITCCGIGKTENADNVGLFGYAKNSTIKSVTIVTENVIGQRNVGIICGYAYRTCISDCKASGHVKGDSYVGGIVGCASYGGVADCHFVGNVTASGYVAGGIVGMLEFGGVVRSYAGGQVSGKYGVHPISGTDSEDVMVSECVDRMTVVTANNNAKKNKKEIASDKLTRLLFQM